MIITYLKIIIVEIIITLSKILLLIFFDMK